MFCIDGYEIPTVVEYLQVAISFVVKEMVVWVVPDGKVSVGWPFERVGGVVSSAPAVTKG